MPSASDHKNVRFSPPFGSVDEATSSRLKAHVTVGSFYALHERDLILLVSRKNIDGMSSGHWVKFAVGALAVSVVRSHEIGISAILDDVKPTQRPGAVVVTGIITSEYCGDELTHYKNDCIARVVVLEALPPPRSGFLTGTLQLIKNIDRDEALRIHEGLEPF